MKQLSFAKIFLFVSIITTLIIACNNAGQVGDVKNRICGTWETYSSTIYDNSSHEVRYPESLFEPSFKWQLVIDKNGTITKLAEDEYSEEETSSYDLYMSNEALEKELIRKVHQRRAAGYQKGGEDNIVLLITKKRILGEKVFQIVSCTEDTLVLRYLSDSSDIIENKFIRIK